MPRGLDHAFGDETVYRRTHKGRAALLSHPSNLSQQALGFLARVNGFTQVRALLDRDGDGGMQVAPTIEALLRQHLIEVVPPPLPPISATAEARDDTGAVAA